MDEKLKTLYELCELVSESLSEAKDKLRKSSGAISVGDADYVDKLTHTLKSIKTTIAMMEAEGEEGGYSGRYMMPLYGYAYNDGRSYADGGRGNSRADSYGGMSNAGRRNAQRDSMGRYSGNYSYAESMDAILEDMRGMMGSLPEEKRREVQRFVDKMDRM